MRAEGETKTTNPINIVQAKVERSLLCVAIGQVTLNVSLTIHRRDRQTSVFDHARNAALRWLPWMAGAALLASMTACSGSTAVGSLSAADLKKPWPLTVDSVVLHCVDRNTVNLEANGVQYMLIGTQDVNNPYGWKKRTEIWAPHDSIPGLKRDIGELIDVVTKKCAAAGRPVGEI